MVGGRIGGKWGLRRGSWGFGPGLEASPNQEAGGGARMFLPAERWEVRIGPGNTISWTMRSVLRRGMAGFLLVPVWRAQRSAGDGRPGERGRAHPAIPGGRKLPPMGYGRATIPPKTAKNLGVRCKSSIINRLCLVKRLFAVSVEWGELGSPTARSSPQPQGRLAVVP